MIKKITSMVLVATMAFSFTACAGKEKDTATKEQKQEVSAYEVLSDVADVSEQKGADTTIDLDIAAEVESDSFAVKGTIDLKGSSDNKSAYAKADASVQYGEESQDIKGEAYVDGSSDEYTVYFGGEQAGGWMKMPLDSSMMEQSGVDVEEYSDAASKEKFDDLFTEENIKKYFDDTAVKEKEVAGVKCYSVTATVNSDTIKEGMDSLSDVAGEDIDLGDSTCDLEICVAKDTKEIKYIGFDANVGDNEYAKVSKCSIGITYNSFDVDTIEIPDDVKSSAVDISSMLSF